MIKHFVKVLEHVGYIQLVPVFGKLIVRLENLTTEKNFYDVRTSGAQRKCCCCRC